MTARIWERVWKQLEGKGYGASRVDVLKKANLERSKHAEYCRVTVAIMREIASLRLQDAGLLFREMWNVK
jgi:hypothetical protein